MTDTTAPGVASPQPPAPASAPAATRSWRTRLGAAGIHLGISAAIFAGILYLILAHWYPGVHFRADGGWQGVQIMVLVDLVLGPTLTLIVFNPRKARHLIAFDLACIGVAQAGALAWGFHVVNSQRPVSVNYYEGAFYSVTMRPLQIENWALSKVQALSERRPPLVFVSRPADYDETARSVLLTFTSQIALHEDPMRYKPFPQNWDAVREAGKPPVEVAGNSRAFGNEWPGWLEAHGGRAGDWLGYPYHGRDMDCVALFTRTGEWADTIGCGKTF